jgi:hypothetical protein
VSPVKPPRPVNHVRPVSLTKEKSFSSSESEYQSCSENVDPDSPFTPTTPTPLGAGETPCQLGINRSYDKEKNMAPSKDKSPHKIQETVMPLLSETNKSSKILENINNNRCVILPSKDREMPRTVAVATKPTPPVSMVTRSRITNPNRPVMIRSRAIEETDELKFQNVKVRKC